MITSFHSNLNSKVSQSLIAEPSIIGTHFSPDATIIKNLDLQNLLKKNQMLNHQLNSTSELNQVLQVFFQLKENQSKLSVQLELHTQQLQLIKEESDIRNQEYEQRYRELNHQVELLIAENMKLNAAYQKEKDQRVKCEQEKQKENFSHQDQISKQAHQIQLEQAEFDNYKQNVVKDKELQDICINDLKSQLQTLKLKKQEMHQKLDFQQQILDQKYQELVDCRLQIQQIEEKYQNYYEQMEAQAAQQMKIIRENQLQILELKTKVSDGDLILTATKQQYNSLSESNAFLKASHEAVLQKLSLQNKSNSQLQSSIESLKNELQLQQSSNDELNANLCSLQQQMVQKMQQAAIVRQQEQDVHQKDTKEKEHQIQNLQQELNLCHQELDDERQNKLKVERELRSCSQKLQTENQDKEKMQRELKSNISFSDDKIKNLQQKLQEMLVSQNQKQQDIQSLKDKLRDSECKYKEQLDSLKVSHSAELDDIKFYFEQNVKILENKNSELQSQLRDTQQQKHIIETSLKSCESSSKDLKNRVVTIQEEQTNSLNQLRQNIQALENLKEEHGLLSHKHSTLIQSHSLLQAQHGQLQSQHSCLQMQYSQLNAQHQVLQSEHKQIQEQVQIFSEELVGKGQILQQLELQLYEKSQQFENEVRKREKDRREMQQKDELQREMDKKEQNQKDLLQNEIESQKLAIEQTESLVAQMKNQYQELKCKSDSLNIKFLEIQSEKDQLWQEKQRLQNELNAQMQEAQYSSECFEDILHSNFQGYLRAARTQERRPLINNINVYKLEYEKMQFQQQQFNEKLESQMLENGQLQRVSNDLERQVEKALDEIQALRSLNEGFQQDLHLKSLELIQKSADFKNLQQKYDYVIQKMEFLECQISQRGQVLAKHSRYY